MESTKFINPQALSSALAVLVRYSLRPLVAPSLRSCATASGLRVYKLRRLHGVCMHAYNYCVYCQLLLCKIPSPNMHPT